MHHRTPASPVAVTAVSSDCLGLCGVVTLDALWFARLNTAPRARFGPLWQNFEARWSSPTQKRLAGATPSPSASVAWPLAHLGHYQWVPWPRLTALTMVNSVTLSGGSRMSVLIISANPPLITITERPHC